MSSPIEIAAYSPTPIAAAPSPPSLSGCPTLAPRAPSLAPSPVASGPPAITTQKEWVIPPRPKPGRKPATDTPPTKRKAQNRAAQRAFRERRAARVNELEDKLKQVADETASVTSSYQSQIATLTKSNAELALANTNYQKQLAELQQRVSQLIDEQSLQSGPSTPGSISIPNSFDIPVQQQVASPAPTDDEPSSSSTSCCRGDSTTASGCACLLAAAAAVATPPPSSLASSNGPHKRPTTPPEEPAKRIRYDFLETDFTTSFSRPSRTSKRPRIARPPPDPCGFCSEGTPCVCAEVANAMDMASSDDEGGFEISNINSFLNSPMVPDPAPLINSSGGGCGKAGGCCRDKPKPVQQQQQQRDHNQLPPLLSRIPSSPMTQNLPSVCIPTTPTSATSPTPPSFSTRAPQSIGSGCNPGNCQQCRNDPMSTLFCQSVMSTGRQRDIEDLVLQPEIKQEEGTRGAGIGGGVPRGMFIPCSAAYVTLSRHRAFDEAAADLGALVRPLVVQQGDEGCPKVEVNSVREVLKMLDRRFGSLN